MDIEQQDASLVLVEESVLSLEAAALLGAS